MPTFQTPEPIVLDLELTVADVRIEAGERSDTVVEVRPSDSGRRLDVTAAEQTRVEYSAGRLLIKTGRRWRAYSPFSEGGAVEIQIGLPAGSRVNGEAALGGFRCTGPLGDCRLKTSIGDIHVEEAAAAALTTGAGGVVLDRATGDTELNTGSGELRAGAIGGHAVIKNSNGDIRLGDVAGEVRVNAANGDIAIDHARASVVTKTANGAIRLGAVRRGSVVAETGLGAVEVGIADGSAAWLDLNTHFGHLHNALEAGGPPGPNNDRVEVRARSAMGDITVHRSYPLADDGSVT
jgi:Putative adhesin